MPDKKIKVLVVDDSALVRKIISDILQKDPAIEVVGTANNGQTAIYKNDSLDPDVITMDIEMPIMDGLESLRTIIATKPKPVIMMSVLTQHGAEATFKAMEYGAVDFIPKPSSILSLTMDDISELLVSKVKSVAGIVIKVPEAVATPRADDAPRAKTPRRIEEVRRAAQPIKERSARVIAIGTSTGGPSALFNVFKNLPHNLPNPVLVVQHMPEGFTKAFAERLNANSPLSVKEAADGDIVRPGWGYIAPGHSHMRIENAGGERIIRVFTADKVSGHRPSIDVLFDSVAETCGAESVGVIMTGMGKDGARGMLNIKRKGGYCVAQDEETSVVFGMNRVAVELGAVDDVVPLDEIPQKIVEHI
ncbi:MAG TPA: chemotaxis response regulator protein-glutamate methylesterase [Spirochaetota bacterium]|nr:chemotaxis response regulator protein-glutamate methylesterase [Spirochaetota bacterium]